MSSRENLFEFEELHPSDSIPERDSGFNSARPKPRPRTILTAGRPVPRTETTGVVNEGFSIDEYTISSSGDHDHDFKYTFNGASQRHSQHNAFHSRMSSSSSFSSGATFIVQGNEEIAESKKPSPYTVTAEADIHYSRQTSESDSNEAQQKFHIENEMPSRSVETKPKPLKPRTKFSPENDRRRRSDSHIEDETTQDDRQTSSQSDTSDELSVKRAEKPQAKDEYLVIPMPNDENDQDEPDKPTTSTDHSSRASFLGKWKKAIRSFSKEGVKKTKKSKNIEKETVSAESTDDETDFADNVVKINQQESSNNVTPKKSSPLSSATSTPSSSLSKREIRRREKAKLLGITIHNADLLPADQFVVHPLVKVTVMNQNGSCYPKRKNTNEREDEKADEGKQMDRHRRKGRKSQLLQDECYPISSDSLLPIMTQPFHLASPSFTPNWNELVVFEEPFKKFVDNNSNCIFFFEIMDFLPMDQATVKRVACKNYAGSEEGWYKIAWAFLKPVGGNGTRNVSRKLRLQLYKPERLSSKHVEQGPEVFSWWKHGKRVKINSTLYVTVKAISPLSCSSANLQTLLTMRKEDLTEALIDSQLKTDKSTEVGGESDHKQGHSTQVIVPVPQWNRLEGQSCKPPNKLHKLLPSSNFDSFNMSISGNVHCVKFSPDGLRLAAGFHTAQLHTILIFEIPSGKLVKSLRCHQGLIYELCWTNNIQKHGRERLSYLASASADSTASVWSFKQDNSVKLVKTLVHPTFVYCIRFHTQQSNLVATGCFDHIIRIWNILKKNVSSKTSPEHYESTPLVMMDQHPNFINCLEFHPEGRYLFSGDGEGWIYKWRNSTGNAKDWKVDRKVKLMESKVPINSISIDPKNGTRLLVHFRQSCLKIVDIDSFLVLHTFLGFTNERYNIHSCLSPCGNLVLSGSEDATLCIWDSDTTRIIQFIAAESHSSDCIVTAVDYHPFDYYVAIGILSSRSTNGEAHPLLLYTHLQQHLPPIQVSTMVKMKRFAKNARERVSNKAQQEAHTKEISELETLGSFVTGEDVISKDRLKEEIINSPMASKRELFSLPQPRDSTDSTDKFMSILWKLDTALKVSRHLNRSEAPDTSKVENPMKSNEIKEKQVVTGKPPIPPKPRVLIRKERPQSRHEKVDEKETNERQKSITTELLDQSPPDGGKSPLRPHQRRRHFSEENGAKGSDRSARRASTSTAAGEVLAGAQRKQSSSPHLEMQANNSPTNQSQKNRQRMNAID